MKDAGIKELTILRQLKNSHFQHSHLCQILDIATEPQSVCDYSGELCMHACVGMYIYVCCITIVTLFRP